MFGVWFGVAFGVVGVWWVCLADLLCVGCYNIWLLRFGLGGVVV